MIIVFVSGGFQFLITFHVFFIFTGILFKIFWLRGFKSFPEIFAVIESIMKFSQLYILTRLDRGRRAKSAAGAVVKWETFRTRCGEKPRAPCSSNPVSQGTLFLTPRFSPNQTWFFFASLKVNCDAHRHGRSTCLKSKCRVVIFLLVKVINEQFFRDHNFLLKNRSTNFLFFAKNAISVLRVEIILQDDIFRA